MQQLSLMVALVLLGCAHGWEGNVEMQAYFGVDCNDPMEWPNGRLTFVKSVSDSAPSQPPPFCLASVKLGLRNPA